MTKRFLTVILITLFSAVAMFANDISQEVQTEQQIELQTTPDFSSNSTEFSLPEKDFVNKYKINPRNTADVWYKYKKLIRTGIGIATCGGILVDIITPSLIGTATGIFFLNFTVSCILYVISSLIWLAGILVQSLCSIPFVQAGILATRYKKLYNVKLKHAAIEARILSLHDSENKEIRMAMSFPIK